jgi:cell division protein FtsB
MNALEQFLKEQKEVERYGQYQDMVQEMIDVRKENKELKKENDKLKQKVARLQTNFSNYQLYIEVEKKKKELEQIGNK